MICGTYGLQDETDPGKDANANLTLLLPASSNDLTRDLSRSYALIVGSPHPSNQ